MPETNPPTPPGLPEEALARVRRGVGRQRHRRLGDLAVLKGYVTVAQLDQALRDEDDRPLGEVLLARGLLTAAQFDELRRELDAETAPAPPPPPSLPRLTLERYELLGKLGEGAMSVVYRARDRQLNRVVALKVLREGGDATGQLLERFHREAALAARLRHPNIVAVHDVGEAGDASPSGPVRYIAMDFIAGTTLAEALPSWRGRWRELAALMEKIARAVHYAHTQGVVHRDLKPQNILLDNHGEPAITDFGLAKELDAGPGLTKSGTAMGTPYYMSPEQIRGDVRHIDHRADVYALGVILYQMIAGRPPFGGATVMEVYRRVATEDPPSLAGVPRDLETIALKAISKEPAKRYISAAHFADDLRRWLSGEPILAKPASLFEKAVKTAQRHPVATLLIAMTFIGTPAAIGAGVVISRHQTEAARRAEVLDAVKTHVEAAEACMRKAPAAPPLDASQPLLEERPQEKQARVQAINALVEADGYLRSCAEQLAALPDTAEQLARVRDRRYEANLALYRWALRGGEYGLARIASSTCESLDRARHGRDRMVELADLMEQASPRHRADRIRTILEDIRRSLYRPGRGPGATTLEDYIHECMRYQDEQTVELLAEALRPLAKRARAEGRTAAWTQEDRDVLTFCFRVLGRSDRDSAVAPLAEMLDLLWDTRLVIEGGLALCNTGRESALPPFAALRERLGLFSQEWRQISRWASRLPIPPIEPRTARDFADLGLLLRDREELERALVAFGKAIELQPDSPAAYLYRGMTLREKYREQEKPDAATIKAAIADFTRAVELDAANAEAFLARGGAHQQQGDIDAAMRDYDRAIELDPNIAIAYRGRARVRVRRLDEEGALADFGRAIELDPYDVWSFIDRGVLRRTRGGRLAEARDPARAIAELNAAVEDHHQAVALDPRGPSSFNSRGETLLARGLLHAARGEKGRATADWDAATADFNRALDVEPRFFWAFSNRGEARRAKGDLAGALADWKKYLELGPEDEHATKVRGWIRQTEEELSAPFHKPK